MARRIEDTSEVMGLPAGSLEDKDLTLAYQRGEDGAYQAIYDRYSSRVHNVCRRMLGNSQDAQDAAQESFLRVYQALGRFNGRYQLGPWITRIATNVCLDHIRAKSRRPKDVMTLEIAELDSHEELEVDGPDDIVIRKSESRRVRKVLESLPPMHRAAIVLRDFEGLSYQEVAIALGITDCQVKALIHRARQGFKRSWTTITLGILLPARFLHRVRKFNAPKPNSSHTSSMHQFAETVTASAAPAASSCSAAFGQCGQFVADKFAPALTAMALGAASLAIPSYQRTTPPETEPQMAEADMQSAAAPVSASRSTDNLHASASDPRPAVEESTTQEPPRPASDTEQPAPVASPAPAATPAPAASPTSAPPAAAPSPPPPLTNSDGGSSGTSAPAPKPAFTAGIGFDAAPAQATPASHQFRLSCVTRLFEQTLKTKVAYGGVTYDATLNVDAWSGRSLHLAIEKDNRTYDYVSWGSPPTVSWIVGERSGEMTMSGDYGPRYGDDPQAAELPGAGTFQVRLAFACNPAPSPTTESVVFTTR